MTLKWAQQLIISLECNIIIGSRGSGRNRMIGEWRCVYGTKARVCKASFIEVGQFEDWELLPLP
ncbi:hypothetical protein BDZ91DRAFT_709453 [Kalaharituber pfeilii]|nr:hypothetical protein BDZ91DRAFT_709453 [Kalaharituber pfeilii]